jgi:acyl-coenzyme A synthetase/AMP-(fatty) acid ligase
MTPSDARPVHLPEKASFIPFWDSLDKFHDLPAIAEPSTQRSWTYKQLAENVAAGAAQLSDGRKRLVLIFATNTADCVLLYLSALRANHAVFLSNHQIYDPPAATIIASYAPDSVFWSSGDPPDWSAEYEAGPSVHGLRQLRRSDHDMIAPRDELLLVLPTSGSTGNPKAVRLSTRNIAANAIQIQLGLDLGHQDRAVTVLPIGYIFGLSVLHSHLASGSLIVIQKLSILESGFWQIIRDFHVTTLAGVPFTYEILRQLRFDPRTTPSISTLIQSGGKIKSITLDWLRSTLNRQLNVYLMYGMTEGAGRLCILHPDALASKSDSVGLPVPFGEVEISRDSEILFRGPNVMLGYAKDRTDLLRRDDCCGALHTGDMGRKDTDGYVYITGRMSRICKILGRRYSLEDIESGFGDLEEVAAVSDDVTITLFHSGDSVCMQDRANLLTRQFNLPSRTLRLKFIPSIPRSLSGKVDYRALNKQIS